MGYTGKLREWVGGEFRGEANFSLPGFADEAARALPAGLLARDRAP